MTPLSVEVARPRALGPASVAGRRPLPRESGFTIVEVMVAMVILVVAVLATLVLFEGSLSSTRKTTAREQGVNLARDLVERTRQVSFANTAKTTAPAALRAALPASDSASALSGRTFTVTRRGTTYTVDIFACAIDDPTDGVNVTTTDFCGPPKGASGPPPSPTATAPAISVLGVSVSPGSNAIDTVCRALGNPDLFAQVSQTVSTVAPLSVCPNAGIGDVASANIDADNQDLHRVRIQIDWNRGTPEQLIQTTLIPNPNP